MQSFFNVHTRTSRQLGISAANVVGAMAASHDPVFLLRLSTRPTLGFMLTSDGRPQTIDGVSFKTAIQPWRVQRVEAGFVLHDPSYGNVLTEREDGTVALRSPSEARDAAVMQLQPVSSVDVTPEMTSLLQLLDVMLPGNLNGPDILDVIIRSLTPQTAELLQAVLRLLPHDQLAWLGGTLLGLPDHLARFAKAFTGDIWASMALPDLRQWLHTRRGDAIIQLPPERDFLAEAGMTGYPVTVGHMLNVAARASIPPRRSVCAVATARNEGLYLVEWIAYHQLIGVEAIFIYSNDNSDGSNDLLRALALAGEITWIENRLDVGHGAQPKAYGHAFGILPGVLDFRWSLVIDLDEFFGFDSNLFCSLTDYIDWQETQHVDAISLNWLVFGSGGAAAWSDAPLVERFTKRLPWIDPHIKSLSRTNLCMQSHPHHAAFPATVPIFTRDSDGEPYRFKDGFSFSASPRSSGAWISHYFLKSAEEFVWKFSRNRGDHALVRELRPSHIETGFASMFLQQHTSSTMIDDRRTLLCAPGLRSQMSRLRNVPGVAAAETRIIGDYCGQIGNLIGELRRPATPAMAAAPFPQLARLCR